MLEPEPDPAEDSIHVRLRREIDRAKRLASLLQENLVAAQEVIARVRTIQATHFALVRGLVGKKPCRCRVLYDVRS